MAKPYVHATNEYIWNTVKDRIGAFKPSIVIEDHVDFEAPKAIDVQDDPSVGVNFFHVKSKRDEFLALLIHKDYRTKPLDEFDRFAGTPITAREFIPAWRGFVR